MARGGRTAKRRSKARGRRHILPALLLALLIPGGFFGWMYTSAALVHVCPAEVYLPDLPAQFDGTTLLYISDVNVRSDADARASVHLMEKLEALRPDVLLLGGDYSAGTMLDTLNGSAAGGSEGAKQFLRALVNFQAPLGKFAVLGEADDAASLANDLSFAGIRLLEDGAAAVERDGARIGIVGLRASDADSTPYAQIARNFRAKDCILVLAHNPTAYTRIRTSEAQGGGAWADLVLSGHTLGGQIKLFGRTLRSFTEEESRRIAGWYYGDDLPALVSQGLGCRSVKLRLGTRSEVWFITLRRPQFQGVEG